MKKLTNTLLTGLALILLLVPLLGGASLVSAQADQPATQVVARVYYSSQTDLETLSVHLDIWSVNKKENYVVAQLSPQEYADLQKAGYRVEIDEAATTELNTPRQALPGQVTGIPGFTCYRTVEETYTSLSSLATNHPDLATWVDIGNSYDKATAGGLAGYDIQALILTNWSTPGPKSRFFLMAEIHAREYVTAETATRFAEYLINHYGTDPDVTFLLDNYEVHIVAMTNPDGRKKAETGVDWRKNNDPQGCESNSSAWGTDLNRNSSFHWGGPGASTYGCDETYRGAYAGSEPEVQAIQNYVLGIMNDQRGPGDTDPAPVDTTGTFISLHSYSNLVLWPWGDVYSDAPNAAGLQTLGRKFAYFNGYTPQQSSDLYPTSGATDDWAYGVLGVAAYTFEMGETFFQSCSSFENTIYPNTLPALLYGMKSSRRPYQNPAGPDILNPSASPVVVPAGTPVTLSATANDTRYAAGETTHNIAAARYSIDSPSWQAGVTTHAMTASDGSFNTKIEGVQAVIDTTGLALGQHLVILEAQDAAGNWGVPTATWLYIMDPAANPTIQGYVHDASNQGPLAATVTAGPFSTTTDPATGFYTMRVISGTYSVTAAATGYDSFTVSNVSALNYQTVQQDFNLNPVCAVLTNDAEHGNQGWTATGTWAISTDGAHSPTHNWSDSPGGNYGNNTNITLTSPVINLGSYRNVVLNFWQTVNTESGWDFGYVEYSTNGGSTWNSLASYTGQQLTWTEQSLRAAGLDAKTNARIRFRMYSDSATTGDGWHLDDIRVTGTSATCTVPLAAKAAFTSNSPVDFGQPVSFSNLSYGTQPISYAWDFGDGVGTSTLKDPVYTYTLPGTYTVTLTAANSIGSSSVSHAVVVHSAPLTALELAQDSPAWVDTPAGFHANFQPGFALKPYTYTLQFDAEPPLTASTSESMLAFTHTFAITGPHTVAMSAWNAAMTVPVTATLPVTVTMPPPFVPLTGVEVSLVGGSLLAGQPVTFSLDVEPADLTLPFTYTLDFGDGSTFLQGSTSGHPVLFGHTYLEAGAYTVVARGGNQAGTLLLETQLSLEVAAAPVAMNGVTLTPDGEGPWLRETPITFTLEVSPANLTLPYTYTVDFADGSEPLTMTTASRPVTLVHTFTRTGVFVIQVRAWNQPGMPPVVTLVPIAVQAGPNDHWMFLPFINLLHPASPQQ